MINQADIHLNGNPAFAVDRQGKIALWNQAAEKTLGYPASAALGRCCWRLLSGQDTYGNQFCHRHCSLRKMAFERRQINDCHLCVRTTSNQRQHYAINSRLISDDSGNDLLLHTCLLKNVSLKNRNGKKLVNGFAANDPQGISLETERGVAIKLVEGNGGTLTEDMNFKLDFTKLLEIGDLPAGASGDGSDALDELKLFVLKVWSVMSLVAMGIASLVNRLFGA